MSKVLSFRSAATSSSSRPACSIPSETPTFLARMGARVARPFLLLSSALAVLFVLCLFVVTLAAIVIYGVAALVASAVRRFRGYLRENWIYDESRSRYRTCPVCREIHPGWHRCQQRLAGFCASCGRKRFLNRFGECNSGHDEVTDVRFRKKRMIDR